MSPKAFLKCTLAGYFVVIFHFINFYLNFFRGKRCPFITPASIGVKAFRLIETMIK